MEPNDLVILLSGGRTPFIARPSDPESATSVGAYRTVGYAYVHAVMDEECRPSNDQAVISHQDHSQRGQVISSFEELQCNPP